MTISVLIVEDDAIAAEALAMRLRAEDMQPHVVAEGYAAIEAVRARRYDAIVLDLIITSGLNGFGVLNYVEMEMPDMLEHIFVVSGMSEQTIMNTAPKLLPRFFRKPFDDRKLIEAIRALVQPPREAVAAMPCVLIAEDDPSFRELLRHIVANLGFGVEAATNGHDVVDLLSKNSYDALILDVVMPELDGFAVLRYLEETKPEMLGRTILMTGLPTSYRRAIDTSKLCAVAEKTMTLPEIRALVQRCVRNEKASG